MEYALGVAFIVLACAAAAAALDTGARGEVNNQANCVETRPPPVSCQRRAVTTSTTLVPPPTSSTTSPPPAPVADTAATNPTAVFNPDPFWQGTVTYTVSAGGSPVDGAIVRVQVTVMPSGSIFFVNCTTNGSGQCVAIFDTPFADTQTLTFAVTEVQLADGFTAGTLPPPTTLSRP